MTDQRVVDVVRAVGRETDAPQELVEALLRGALPSIRLVEQFPREGEAPPLGGCRIGGLPDLPEGVRWPRLSAARKSRPSEPQRQDEPLWFLLQVNLTEVARADVAFLCSRVFLSARGAMKVLRTSAGPFSTIKEQSHFFVTNTLASKKFHL
jgi:hypothetical protein